MTYIISGYWLLQQYQVWVSSHGVVLPSNQKVAGHCHDICVTIAQVYLADRSLLYVAGLVGAQCY